MLEALFMFCISNSYILSVCSGIEGGSEGLKHWVSLLLKVIFSWMNGDGFSLKVYSTLKSQLLISVDSLFLSKLSNKFVKCLFNAEDIWTRREWFISFKFKLQILK